jgi:formate hydrogenlyase subunit 6/NADH:ubiquinone oxidoreductase subunit I
MTNKVELPHLDITRCTGCADCVRACPTACLEMAGPLPWLPRPLDCISCELCVWLCPANALHLAEMGGI